MKRRRVLAGLGGVGSLSLLWGGIQFSNRPVRIRYWLSPGAARVADHGRLVDYVEVALEPAMREIEVSYGGIVPVNVEHGYEVMQSGEWPLRLITGNRSGSGPVPDANLLITDGPLGPDPPGFARGPFASIGGARHLEGMPDRDEVDDVVQHDATMYTLQIFLHELGHTLGLDHEHGTIDEVEEGHVASPMVSGYAWQPSSTQFSADQSHCGQPYPTSADGDRYLSLSFSECALATLRSSGPRF